MNLITLESRELSVQIDIDRGADVLSFTDKENDLNLLFSTPWRERADRLNEGGQAPLNFGTFSNWLEGYRGGWQTLCPISGPQRNLAGTDIGFHGEASIIPWDLLSQSENCIELKVNLFTVPIQINRKLVLDNNKLVQTDNITNQSSVEIEIDYSSHPAFSGLFIEGDVEIDCGAKKLYLDSDSKSFVESTTNFSAWPVLHTTDDETLDLRKLPAKGTPWVLFGWLEDFEEQWASITNYDLGISCRLTWDSKSLPYAWLWQELEGTATFPWFKKARAIAFEPSSSQTNSSGAKSTIQIKAHETIEIPISLELQRIRRGES